MSNVLVIDDDKELTELLKEFLSNYNFNVSITHNPSRGIELATDGNADLVILDIMMPEIDGFKVLRKIRAVSNIPVIMLTARGKVEDRIVGLELGADDYLGKPFEPQELLLRIKNIIKSNMKNEVLESSKIGDAELNLSKMTIRLNQKIKKINSAEKRVLLKMLASPGKIFSRNEIGKISKISKERSIDVMITRLRKKIEINPKNPKFLQTIRGSGYVLWVK